MESRYSPSDIESRWLESWNQHSQFAPQESSKGTDAYSLVIPPPNVTGALHLGHALNNTVQDILTRWQRKSGKRTLWVPGTDHAGIATQAVVEKRLKEDENKTRHDIGREALVKRIWDWKDEYEARISGQLQAIGSSCDWKRQRFTLDPMCAQAVRQTFFKLFAKDLVYRGKRLVNWDAHLQTAVADDEIEHINVKGHMWYFRYPLADGSDSLPVATTRPETLLGDTAVAVNSQDDRYKHLIGKKLKIPFVDREIEIISDDILVDPDFGTGCVKVTPAHDPNDYETGLRNNLEMINLLNEDGTFNENAGPFAGLDRKEVRTQVVAGLEELGLMDKIEDHEHQVGHSDRSKTPIEPYLSDQWFVAMSEIAEPALEAVRQKRIKFHPERYANTYLDWLGEKRDWCISRQLWWGHQIPIWTCDTCTEKELESAWGSRDDIVWKQTSRGFLICAAEEDLPEDAIPGHRIIRDPDVLDTWFSSALWPLSTLGWPEKTPLLEEFFPTSVLVTGRDIISLWVARMVVFSLVHTDQVPFRHVYIHPTIMDGQGQRMSKSKGNGVDPLDIVDQYGTDALRFTMTSLATDNQDSRLPVKKVKDENGQEVNTSEKFEQGRNFANKLWNASRFVQPHLAETGDANSLKINPELLALEDHWILSRLNTTILKVNQSLEAYKFSEIVNVLYKFTWDDFCSRYLEIKKPIITGQSSELKTNGLAVFASVLKTLIHVLHPVMPFITEELNQVLFNTNKSPDQNLIVTPWPQVDETAINKEIEDQFEAIFGIVEAVRSVRGQYSVSPTQPLSSEVHFDSQVQLRLILSSSQLIQTLAKLENLETKMTAEAPQFSAQTIINGGIVYVALEGILDKEKEISKLEKEISKTKSFISGLEKKLSNERFVNNAPEAVVEGEKNKLANQKETLAKAEAAIAELKA